MNHRCSSLGNDILPWKFDECGLMMVAERGMPWYGDDTVIPSEAWPNVTGFLNDIVGVGHIAITPPAVVFAFKTASNP